MYLTKEKIEQVMAEKGIMTHEEVESAFDLVNELLEDEADAMKEAESEGLSSEKEYRRMAYKVFQLGQEVKAALEKA